MDWNWAIERHREALKRVVAMLVAMAGCSPLADGPARRAEPLAGEGVLAPTLPRHLHRAVLRLLRPAESAARRLIVVAARGLVVTLPPPRPRRQKPRPTILRGGIGTGIVMPAGAFSSRAGVRAGGAAARKLSLPLLDPLRRVRRRGTAAPGVPRISLPGVTAPFPVAPRRPPAQDDRVDVTRLALRLAALGAALDDLPGQARRFARWKAGARRARRRAWPLRPGRPPGQRPARRRAHEVHDILNDLHGLAFDALEHPDTS
jgi:hypothetical protein